MHQYKQLFTIPDHITYLNCAYMSPQLKSIKEIGKSALSLKDRPWELTAADFFTKTDELRSLVAQLLSAENNEIAIIPSASYGINTIASNLNLNQSDSILVLEDQFPSNYYPWYERAKIFGAKIKVVKRPQNYDWASAIIAALDENVKLAALANVHWTDGTLINLEKIAKRCKELNILLSLDLTQSVGVKPFSVKNIDPDFIVAAAYKWMFGPYSMAYMYVKKNHHNMKPLEDNWINRAKSDEFSLLIEYTDEFQEGAKRFDVGERSNFLLTPLAIEGLKQILNWGTDKIYTHCGILTDYLVEQLDGSTVKIADKEFRSKHMIGLNSDKILNLIDVIREKNIYISIRGKSIRVSPHLYNEKADMDKLVQLLK